MSAIPLSRRGSATRHALAALLAAVGVLATPATASAQLFDWPWSKPEPKPVPREPVYRAPSPGQAPEPGAQPAPAESWSGKSPICLKLEQRLVQESQRGSQSRDLLPQIDAERRAADRAFQSAQSRLESKDCYEYFLFTKSLRKSRECIDLNNQAEASRRKLSELEAQRLQITGSASVTNQDEIIRELARNNCGGTYTQEAKRRDRSPFGGLWQDEEGTAPAGGNQYGALPFATYRTLCVRLCDGYYFPVSFSTLPNHFQRDAEICQSKCAAPVQLYYHQNPGGAVEQAVAADTSEPYAKLKTAFRYRKEYVQGCSCKEAEYKPQTPIPGAPAAAGKRAEALPAPPSQAEQLPWRPR
jgi:hypothetical protein